MNPILFMFSPFVHLAHWFVHIPLLMLWGFGFRDASVWAWIVALGPNWNQHLGFDPLPWLTKLNHYYFYGAIPWIPLHHQYHHCPFVKRGNFGNVTALWDYVFGTIIPESVEHIETGKVPKSVQQRFDDPDLNQIFIEKFKGRNQLDYNTVYDRSIFNFRYI